MENIFFVCAVGLVHVNGNGPQNRKKRFRNCLNVTQRWLGYPSMLNLLGFDQYQLNSSTMQLRVTIFIPLSLRVSSVVS